MRATNERSLIVLLWFGGLVAVIGGGTVIFAMRSLANALPIVIFGVLLAVFGAAVVIVTGMNFAGSESPESVGAFPVSIDARLDEPLSRWLWMVKWILAAPHYAILFFYGSLRLF